MTRAIKEATSVTEQTIGPHDWTHPAESCDEPDCDHVTRRTCEGAAKVEKFLRDTLRKRTELLRKADPAWAKQADANIARALFEVEAEEPWMDWQQVLLNGGPPCYALLPEDRGRYCGRAKRWSGHDSPTGHEFVAQPEPAGRSRA